VSEGQALRLGMARPAPPNRRSLTVPHKGTAQPLWQSTLHHLQIMFELLFVHWGEGSAQVLTAPGDDCERAARRLACDRGEARSSAYPPPLRRFAYRHVFASCYLPQRSELLPSSQCKPRLRKASAPPATRAHRDEG
jgi:hypothetical protein